MMTKSSRSTPGSWYVSDFHHPVGMKTREFFPKSFHQGQKTRKNPTYQAASGDAVPKSALNATRAIKVTLQDKILIRHVWK